MKSKIIYLSLFCLLISLSACGFKKVRDSNIDLFYANNIITNGDKKFGYYVKNEILLNSSKNSKNKIDMIIDINKTNKIKAKNVSGKVTKYNLTVDVKLTINELGSGKNIMRNFSKSVEYNVGTNHTTTLAREKKTIESIKGYIGEEINNFLNIYFRN
jgi:outer membrane lipopolysaccharide assembly protein LptE/RlpB